MNKSIWENYKNNHQFPSLTTDLTTDILVT